MRSPLRWLRAFIVAEARGVVFGEDLIRLAASRQSTFPIGGRLRNALRPASIRVVFKVDDITLWGRYQSQTEPSPVMSRHGLGDICPQCGKEDAFLDAGVSPERAAEMAAQVQRLEDENISQRGESEN